MKALLPSPRTIHWGHFDASLAPIEQIDDGETLFVRSVSDVYAPDDPVPSAWIPPEIRSIQSEVRERGPGPHILSGPVFIGGARPGDILQVDILSLRLGAPYGCNLLLPLLGMFPDRIDYAEKQVIPFDLETGHAIVQPGVRIAIRPFFGIMGVAPPVGWGRISSAQPRQHGGNLDNKELVAGTTLFLPVWVDGGLFSVGDGHAAQGDGEVDITAIEACLEGELRLSIRRDFELSLPLVVTPTHLITMGFADDLDQAARIAVSILLELLERYCRLPWRQGYRLASIAADLRVTQVVNGMKGIHVAVSRDVLAQLGGVPPFLSPKAA